MHLPRRNGYEPGNTFGDGHTPSGVSTPLWGQPLRLRLRSPNI